nr:hypothetical protein [Kibdelosporangium sp. MJ126-NF4]CEL15090.1 hypothetical protein [Kibdelosporangium sp. MJ126-NF4]CTQ93316.1 hypothetical protein [Kibdelosporangium sp. MJ126-NF4]
MIVLLLLGLVLLLGYLASCLVFTHRACRACKGAGRFTGGLLGGVRPCPRCNGRGIECRAGSRAINAMRRNRRDRRNRY